MDTHEINSLVEKLCNAIDHYIKLVGYKNDSNEMDFKLDLIERSLEIVRIRTNNIESRFPIRKGRPPETGILNADVAQR